jgi:hypothetical protein
MPKRNLATVTDEPEKGNRRPYRAKKMKVLAKMLLKCAKKEDGDFDVPDKPNRKLKSFPIIAQQPATQQPLVGIKKPRKPRPPATGKALAWQKTFAEVRKQHPGKRSPAFEDALRAAGQRHRQRFATTK